MAIEGRPGKAGIICSPVSLHVIRWADDDKFTLIADDTAWTYGYGTLCVNQLKESCTFIKAGLQDLGLYLNHNIFISQMVCHMSVYIMKINDELYITVGL